MPFFELDPSSVYEFGWGAGYEEAERPFVEVELAATSEEGVLLGRPIRTALLVDSGARATVLDGRLAPTLGLDLSEERYEKRYIGGIVPGASRRVAIASVLASICGRWLPIRVGFTIDLGPTENLLGREGFFDAHLVAFAHAHRAVLLADSPSAFPALT